MDSVYWVPTRQSMALGVSLGWSIGLLPLYGFHVALALLIGSRIRCHLPTAVLGTYVANPLTIPAILMLQYFAGTWLIQMSQFNSIFKSFGPGLFTRYALPFILGGVMSAIAAGVVGYFCVNILLARKLKEVVNEVV